MVGRRVGRLLGVVVLAVVASTNGAMASPRAAAGPPLPPGPVPGSTCVRLSTWSNARLAARTIVVPVAEADVAGVTSEVAKGAGGVILFGSVAPADLGDQIARLYRPYRRQMLVMSDEEGGGIQRMANLVGRLPWAKDMAQQWTPSQIRSNVAAMARRMSSHGVNMDLAPVVDVDGRDEPPSASNPVGWRSFSGTTSVVSQDGLAFARGLVDGGVIPVLKHFPGLGGATGNTDNGPADTLPWSTLQQVALPPFTAGIQAGMPAIMVSNAAVPEITTRPASLSPTMITTQLRQTMGFDGLVITDSLSAGAITGSGFSVPSAAVQALRSGVDMVIYGPTGSLATTHLLFDQIVAAEVASVTSGALPRSRLISAVTRVLAVQGVRVCS